MPNAYIIPLAKSQPTDTGKHANYRLHRALEESGDDTIKQNKVIWSNVKLPGSNLFYKFANIPFLNNNLFPFGYFRLHQFTFVLQILKKFRLPLILVHLTCRYIQYHQCVAKPKMDIVLCWRL